MRTATRVFSFVVAMLLATGAGTLFGLNLPNAIYAISGNTEDTVWLNGVAVDRIDVAKARLDIERIEFNGAWTASSYWTTFPGNHGVGTMDVTHVKVFVVGDQYTDDMLYPDHCYFPIKHYPRLNQDTYINVEIWKLTMKPWDVPDEDYDHYDGTDFLFACDFEDTQGQDGG